MEPDDAQGFMMAVGKLKEGDIPQLRYVDGGSKPTAFERWSQLVELKVSSLHPEAAVYWQSVRMAAGAAYDQYLWLNPMQKVRVAVDITSIPARYIALEMKLRAAILAALPETVMSMALATHKLAVAELLFAAMVDAGPGTQSDREHMHRAVTNVASGDIKDVYAQLQQWRFDLDRLVRLGMQPPDPTLQHRTLKSMEARMASKDSAFQYRLHAFQMNAGMFGMVTQDRCRSCGSTCAQRRWSSKGVSPRRTRSTRK
jgi:hypothetical protein